MMASSGIIGSEGEVSDVVISSEVKELASDIPPCSQSGSDASEYPDSVSLD